MPLRRGIVAVLAVLAGCAVLAPAAGAKVRCSGDPSSAQRLDLTVAGEPAWGVYALPASAPRGLVVFFHGDTHAAPSWEEHVNRPAAQEGVIAVAMDYRGQVDLPPEPGTTLP